MTGRGLSHQLSCPIHQDGATCTCGASGRVPSPPFRPYEGCPHEWGEWQFSNVDAAQFRFCALCGVMEQQWIEDTP